MYCIAGNIPRKPKVELELMLLLDHGSPDVTEEKVILTVRLID